MRCVRIMNGRVVKLSLNQARRMNDFDVEIDDL